MNQIRSPDLPLNTSLSLTLPTLQLAWDSTSLGELKTCPRKYQLAILEGWVPRHTSVHLLFGLWYHGALEGYDHARSKGLSHEDALDRAVDFVLRVTWDSKLNRPWISDDSNKTRLTLLRTVVWYLEQFGANDPLQTLQLANGKPAVELSFRFDSEARTRSGEPILICGHLDRVATFNDTVWVADRKTTKHTITQDFFNQFSPDNQMSTYSVAGKVVYNLPIAGVIVDGAQVAITFSRFLRGFVPRKDEQLDEWMKDFQVYMEMAEYYATKGYWPQNDKACNMYLGCQFRGICGKAPGVRDAWLSTNFTRRVWDPLVARGDI